MKKSIKLLIAFTISFLVFTSNVDAAKELTCTYNIKCETSRTFTATEQCSDQLKIVQKDDGTISYYFRKFPEGSSSANMHLEIEEWYKNNTIEVNYKKTDAYDKESNTLSKCPEHYKYSNKKYHFYDKDKNNTIDIKESKSSAESEENFCKSYIPYRGTMDEINNESWKAKCQYENGNNKLQLYFNNEKSIMLSLSNRGNVKYCMPINELNKNGGNCPSFIYYNPTTDSFHLNKKTQNGTATQSLMLTEYEDDEEIIKQIEDIKSCEDLLGDEIIKDINKVMNIMRITVPILLIIFGILDFFKATFAGKEDEMKKSKDKFIKRIIAAVIVFLIPIFVNLILSLANDVWDNINPNTCINEK